MSRSITGRGGKPFLLLQIEMFEAVSLQTTRYAEGGVVDGLHRHLGRMLNLRHPLVGRALRDCFETGGKHNDALMLLLCLFN